MSTVLELKNVSKKLGGRKVVDNLSFCVDSGEIFGFLGPNGAGKTTTIKMIVGLLSVDSGEILVDGKSVKRNFEKAMQKIGGIIENPEMYEYMSGKANLKMYAKMYGRIPKKRIDEVVELVGLTGRINDKVKKYSLGMRQRLGLAQALLHEPKLLILDEPTNGLDPAGIKELRDTLRTLADEKGVSVLVSSHLLSEMELMCDRFLIIDKGVLTDIKSLKDIREQSIDGVGEYSFDVSDGTKAVKLVMEYINNARKEEADKRKRLDSLTHDTTADAGQTATGSDASVEDVPSEYKFLPLNIDNVSNLSLTKEQVADVVEIFVRNGIRVYGINRIVHTLEEEFLAMTNESKEATK
ncbi:MAG: ABC transporter ATP-binding protein [Anaerofustis stercorihominis]|nr:ABC transporter ATP-binding protein [Anaerofustis stercorihominis]